ncbi:DUF475 domain-containing protein [Deinococcus hopiensis]|uniref:Integral membrane protein, YkoY family n=1 Tax=Deinococcus hopiensis KR-140 TaxID=695939 RepID=A0A1W1V515_9DEIO|nr:DUF475 domain-containing protein [Deinococcus hopiensis]SMB88432.1 hypothetical protein SAMN00790413_00043 [Deinococcus hopiensis KR-140]
MIAKEFGFAFGVTVVALILAFWFGLSHGGLAVALNFLVIAVVLGVMEVSLSFDNAVVNASVLKNMSEKWQRRFLVWGILIAVVGMRLIFPIAIVSLTAGLGFGEVANLALNNAEQYAEYLEHSEVAISAFGGVFLLMVALNYLMDPEKDEHWLAGFERRLAGIGKLDTIQAMIAGLTLLLATHFLVAPAEQLTALTAGMIGLLLYLGMNAIGNLFDADNVAAKAGAAGFSAFMYLEVLDASFSLDGVIGAFAVTKEVVIIAAGLAIGAVFVRSLTLFLVHQGTLAQYRYLEHGAHYGILALAIIMLLSTNRHIHIPELVTGLIGVAFIVLSVWSSIRANRREALGN